MKAYITQQLESILSAVELRKINWFDDVFLTLHDGDKIIDIGNSDYAEAFADYSINIKHNIKLAENIGAYYDRWVRIIDITLSEIDTQLKNGVRWLNFGLDKELLSLKEFILELKIADAVQPVKTNPVLKSGIVDAIANDKVQPKSNKIVWTSGVANLGTLKCPKFRRCWC